ncbi:hypothetical protein GCM10009677_29310 [Sphaerisporangium rubeum]|uniref:DUF3800 domain-containing protein n=1 Tax=Sphaerisporangium rubeum TaxID=321317 RepID=A0A7X0IEF1_9ACTN|nr:hypothetical protein [Sphaerisporangium rubeum]MBB6473729.1 hypothetical protein [Sphaerisporangium rubeum]
MLTAFVDESLRRRPDDDSVYAMAAVIIDSADHDDIRTTLESLRMGKRGRLHWRDESSPHRLHIAETVAKLPLCGIVTVRIHDRSVRHERARRLCLERLLQELDMSGVETVVLESRCTEDRLDRSLLTSLRRSRRVSLTMKVSWESPFHEPLLWAADTVVGATTWWLDGEPRYFDALAGQVRVICLD